MGQPFKQIKRLSLWAIGSTMCLGLLAGCGLIGPSTDQQNCSTDGFLFQDDFTGDANCGWAVYEELDGGVAIQDGALQISSRERGQFWWTNPGESFDDVVISVQARQVSGPDNNAYGVLCRYQDPSNYYAFLISGDGYYAIAKFTSDQSIVEYLTGDGEYVYADIVNQGTAINEIRASCVGNELSLTVNGIKLVTVNDNALTTGDIGLGVAPFENGESIVQFDRVRAVAP